MKAITIKQPWASLIVEGVKDIENRTWATKFRGRVLIHASAKPVNMRNPNNVFTSQQWDTLTIDKKVQLMSNGTSYLPLSNSSIIGSVEIVDCVINHSSVWAERTDGVLVGNKFFTKEDTNTIYNWILANPIMFPVPIPAKGRLSFWDYSNILAEPEEEGGELFCHCQLPIKETDQVMHFFDGKHKCRYCGGQWYK